MPKSVIPYGDRVIHKKPGAALRTGQLPAREKAVTYSTVIRWTLARSDFGKVIVSTPS